MKARHLIYLIPAVALFVGCKGKSKVANSDANTITVSVEYTQQYCGGAAPTEEMEEQMNVLQPLANQPIYISKFISPVLYTEEIKVTLDKAGYATFALDTGLYVISFYKLMTPPAPVEEAPKSGNAPKPGNTPETPEQPNGNIGDDGSKEACEMRWKRMTATPFKVVGGKTAYKVAMNKECNPCEEPRP